MLWRNASFPMPSSTAVGLADYYHVSSFQAWVALQVCHIWGENEDPGSTSLRDEIH